MTLEKRILSHLRRHAPARFSALDICMAFEMSPGSLLDPSQELQVIIEALCKLKRQEKISGDYPTPARPEFVYWIEPPRESP